MLSDSDMIGRIGGVLSEKLLIEVESPDLDLLEGGLVDSVGLVELILELEQHFGVSLPVEGLQIDDFRSIRSIAGLIVRSAKDIRMGM